MFSFKVLKDICSLPGAGSHSVGSFPIFYLLSILGLFSFDVGSPQQPIPYLKLSWVDMTDVPKGGGLLDDEVSEDDHHPFFSSKRSTSSLMVLPLSFIGKRLIVL